MRTKAAALMLLALSACSGLQVTAERSWDAEFAAYRTYAWSQGSPARDPTIESHIRDAVEVELPFKGLKKVEKEGSPDLYVSTYASVEDEKVIDHWGYEVRTGGTDSSPVSVLALPMGTLVIDLVEARTDKLVWRGQARRAVDRQVSEVALRKVVREIFRRYPAEG